MTQVTVPKDAKKIQSVMFGCQYTQEDVAKLREATETAKYFDKHNTAKYLVDAAEKIEEGIELTDNEQFAVDFVLDRG
jgi:hypothetical protein